MKSKKWSTIAVMAVSLCMAILDNTIVNVTLPQMQNAFQTDFPTISLVFTAYILAQAAIIPIVGYLSDLIGSKRAFLAALALFTIGSLLCALSPTKEALIAFRALQGIGAGSLVPLTYATAYRLFPPHERSKAATVLGVPMLLAPAFGPAIGGYLSTAINWNAVFFVNVPIGIVTLPLAFLLLPEDKPEQKAGVSQRLDILGLLLSVVGSIALVYGITELGSRGLDDTMALTSLLFGVVVLIAFVIVELRTPNPVLDLRLFLNYTFSISNILMWISFGIFIGSMFFLPLFFEKVQGNTALTAGSFLIAPAVATAAGTLVSGRLYKSTGPRVLIVSGLLFMVVGTYGLTQIDINTTGQALQIWLILLCFGLGLLFLPLQTLVLSMISNEGMAKASSLVSATRQVAAAICVAALTTYQAQQATAHVTDINNALQTHNFSGAAATCAQFSGPTLQTCIGQQATIMGIDDTFWLVLISCAIGVLLALVVGRDPALEAAKKAQPAQASSVATSMHAQDTAPTPSRVPTTTAKSIPNVISTLTTTGEQILGPELLLWHSPENNIVQGSVLTVDNNHFCVLKCHGTILNVYETGLYTVENSAHPHYDSTQLTFSGESIPWEYKVLYINRAKLLVKASGVALSREMVEMDYRVDYYIHVATSEDAIQLVRQMPYGGHTLSIEDVNAYAMPIIEETVNQLLLLTPLERVNSKIQDLRELVHQRLQEFLSSYGITLDAVKMLGLAPHDKYMRELISLKTFGLSELDAVRYSTAMMQHPTNPVASKQDEELEQNLYRIGRKMLDRYANEIVALQAELEKTRAHIGSHIDAYRMRLQELSHAINSDLRASAPILEIEPLPEPHTNRHSEGAV
jgi:EmrB/QacA subfamily drug resistance transporter